MATQTVKSGSQHGQLISVTQKDTTRLLEIYVKRSLSVNDGLLRGKRHEQRQKWVTPENKPNIRRHSSDPSIHLALDSHDVDNQVFEASEVPTTEPVPSKGEFETIPMKSKKKQKSSLWKGFLSLFSKKGGDDKENELELGPEKPVSPSEPDVFDNTAKCIPLNVTPEVLHRRKSKKSNFTKRRRSLMRSFKRDSRNDIDNAPRSGVESIVSVEPTYDYYEKVSEELEKIVHEVKEKEVLTNDEIINRIITLTKEEADAIHEKLKDNPTLSNIFNSMSYTSFQKLADSFLQGETLPTQDRKITVSPTAPELVKLAFTLDFTARIAGLSKQNVGHITGLGRRYLEDRFEYKQACKDNPWSDSDEANE